MNTQQRLLTLTPREREVLDLVIAGKANKCIAGDLDLSQRTVEIHRARLMSKMRVRSVAELVSAMSDLEHEQELEQLNAAWMGTVLAMFKQVA